LIINFRYSNCKHSRYWQLRREHV